MNAITLEIQDSSSLDLSMTSDQTLMLGLERSTGTNNYEALVNKPSIEGHVLIGDSTLPQVGVGDITPQDIDRIIFGG